MAFKTCRGEWVYLWAFILSLASPVSAQLGEQLKSYTGRNAPGYLEPLVDAFGADLYAGLYHTACVPADGLQISFEMKVMSARFSEGDKSFVAFTESGFRPEQSTEVPTVIGSRNAVYVEGESGTRFAFPGGFDLASLDFAVPQLRVGSFRGTEAVIRFGLLYTDNADLGDFRLYGFGFRHSLSQYVSDSPVDVAAGAFWQRFSLGENERGGHILSADSWTVGVQLSRRFSWLEPYAGVAYDDFGIDLRYEGEAPEDRVEMSLDSKDHFHMTLGCSVNFWFMAVHGEYNLGGQDTLALGLAVGFHPLR